VRGAVPAHGGGSETRSTRLSRRLPGRPIRGTLLVAAARGVTAARGGLIWRQSSQKLVVDALIDQARPPDPFLEVVGVFILFRTKLEQRPRPMPLPNGPTVGGVTSRAGSRPGDVVGFPAIRAVYRGGQYRSSVIALLCCSQRRVAWCQGVGNYRMVCIDRAESDNRLVDVVDRL